MTSARNARSSQPRRNGRVAGWNADRRPGDDRGRQDEHREGMGIAAVPSEGGDRVRERPEDVEVREESAESSPQWRPPPDLAPEGRFSDGSAEGDLGDDVHGARSARSGGGRSGGMGRRRAASAGRVARRRHPIFGRLSYVRRGAGTNRSRMTTRGEFAKSHADRPVVLPIPPARRPRDDGRRRHRPPGDWGDGRRRQLPGLVEVDIFSALDWWLRPGEDVVRVTKEPFRDFV